MSNWTCSSCGALVPMGAIHSCGAGPAWQTPVNHPWTMTTGNSSDAWTFQRIATALERIAQVLEGRDEATES